jgi:hypothetical protein
MKKAQCIENNGFSGQSGQFENRLSFTDFLTPKQLAEKFNISVRTLQRWSVLRLGPPHIVVQSKTLYNEQSVLKWLSAKEATSSKILRK